jgi:hypothetical protein
MAGIEAVANLILLPLAFRKNSFLRFELRSQTSFKRKLVVFLFLILLREVF